MEIDVVAQIDGTVASVSVTAGDLVVPDAELLKIAADARLPIVPLRIHGSHLATPVLWRGGLLLATLFITPRYVLGLRRYPVTLSGVGIASALVWWGMNSALGAWGVALALLWLAMPFHVAWPALPLTYHFQFGRPIELSELFEDALDPTGSPPPHGAEGPASSPSDEVLGRAYARVRAALHDLRIPEDASHSVPGSKKPPAR